MFDELVYNGIKEIDVGLGGDAMNQAITLSRLGHDTYLTCRVGNDAMGTVLMDIANKNGINTSLVKAVDGIQTQTVIGLCGDDEDKDRVFLQRNNKTSTLTHCISDIDLNKIKDAKVLTFGGMLWLTAFSDDMLAELFRIAKERNIITCGDVSLYGHEKATDLKKAFHYLDYFIPNYDEACQLSGETNPEKIADVFMSLGVRNVVIKMGGDGCYIKNYDISQQFSAFDVNVLNTTGAGDNFVAGFISGILDGETIEGCAIRGAATAALTIQQIGANSAVTSKAQVDEFIRTHLLKH